MPLGSFSTPSAAMSLGPDAALASQVKGETEEERKKRLKLQQQMSLMGPAAMSLGLTGNGAFSA